MAKLRARREGLSTNPRVYTSTFLEWVKKPFTMLVQLVRKSHALKQARVQARCTAWICFVHGLLIFFVIWSYMEHEETIGAGPKSGENPVSALKPFKVPMLSFWEFFRSFNLTKNS